MDNQVPDITILRELLSQERFAEAETLLKNYFSSALSKEEAGQAYLDVAEMYLDISNHFSKQKKELMETALAAIGELDKKGKKLDDTIKLEEVRKKIQDS